MKTVEYSLSAGNWGDGKSVCLWRKVNGESMKVAKFQSDEVARLFAEEFEFPLSDSLRQRFGFRRIENE